MKAKSFKAYLLMLTCILTMGIVFSSCTKTDLELSGDVRNAIVFKYSRVEVKVNNGVVTLSGQVASEDDKADAQQLATDVEGVKRVNNTIKVVIPVTPEQLDAELKESLEKALAEAKFGDIVKVEVKGLNVTLSSEKKVKVADQKEVMEIIKKFKTRVVTNHMK